MLASLGLGGNVGDVAAAFVAALRALAAAPGIRLTALSSVYRTPPWGKRDQPDFLNMAALLQTALPPRELLARCLDAERALGRLRLERWGPRTIDIDILTYGETIIDEPELKIPHPRLAERAFALGPLAEIAPRLRFGGRDVTDWLAATTQAGIDIDPAASAILRAAKLLDNGRE
ncbi:MAG: 2-amino-4-hydroxy-6-hydroxymethyldihydropteridine diphosphokinase [Bradyrhizobium sp.]|nr:MAG: 2-amino-4-hydroxy-6-hydroxymethyldihydropteridine diphosphokinase [Bradyrhizobium sp.]